MAGDSDEDVWEYKSKTKDTRLETVKTVLLGKKRRRSPNIPIIAHSSQLETRGKTKTNTNVRIKKGKVGKKASNQSKEREVSTTSEVKDDCLGRNPYKVGEDSCSNSMSTVLLRNNSDIAKTKSNPHTGHSIKVKPGLDHSSDQTSSKCGNEEAISDSCEERKICYNEEREKVFIMTKRKCDGNIDGESSTSDRSMLPRIIPCQIANIPTSPKSEKKETKNVTTKDTTVTPRKGPSDGYCPFCQMPFKCLLIESPRWHTTECMDVPILSEKECPKGFSCDSTIASHYRKYRHTLLADKRAGVLPSHPRPETEIDKLALEQEQESGNLSQSPLTPQGLHPRSQHHLTASGSGNKVPSFKSSVPATSPRHNSKRKLFFSAEQNAVRTKIGNARSTMSNDLLSVKAGHASDDTGSEDDIFFDASDGLNLQKEKCLSVQKELPGPSVENFAVDFGPAMTDRDLSDMLSDGLDDGAGTAKLDSVDENISEEALSGKSEQPGPVKQTLSQEEEDEEFFAMLETPFDDSENVMSSGAAENKLESNVVTNEEHGSQHALTNFISGGHYVKNNAKFGTRQTSIQNFFIPKTIESGKPKNTTQQNQSAQASSSSSWNWKSLFLPKKPSTNKASAQGQSTKFGNSSVNMPTTSNQNRGKKPCPFYKKMPGTPFTVDAFRYGSIPGCLAYFLTHFHYDHYGGLTRKFSHPIYCTKITGNLVKKKIGVDPQFIKTIPLDNPIFVEGVEVTFLDANHCPGSVLILFKLPNGNVILHTGDFRASTDMESYPQLQNLHVNQLYLDTTYCDPAYAFPPQKDVVAFAVDKASEIVHQNPDTLVVVGSYTIGKERIFLAIADDLNSRICVNRDKKNVLDCLEDAHISKRVTLAPYEARVHVLPMRQLNFQNLSKYLEGLRPRYAKILAFEPTGWTHSGGTRHVALEKLKPKLKRDNITVYGVPYSEHSSYTEMKRFCQFLRPDRILATVNNGNPASRKKMESIFDQWMKEKLSTPQKKQSGIKGWLKN